MFVIVVYVPTDFVQSLIDVLARAGAGEIGDYQRCAFMSIGEGTFQPSIGANPFIGSIDEIAVVEEVKVEMVCMETFLEEAVRAMIEAHPYETPAYHVYRGYTVEELKTDLK